MLYITYEDLQSLLPRAVRAQIKSPAKERELSCLPGTRLTVLQDIKRWAEDRSGKRCIFGLNGMAGTQPPARPLMRPHSAFIGLKAQGCSIEYHHMYAEHTTLNQNADALSRLHATITHTSSEYGSPYKAWAATYLHGTFVLFFPP